jgi:preprotein translocase subunit SecA
MRAADLPAPGLLLGDYPERPAGPAAATGGVRQRLTLPVDRLRALRPRPHARLIEAFEAQRKAVRDLTEAQCRERADALRISMRREGLDDVRIAAAFSLVDSAYARTLRLRAYPTQVIAAAIVLDNRLAEMATGEGKTLAIGLAAATAALAGMPVHVVTANDYLVGRDADLLRQAYAALGLTVGTVVQSATPAERRVAYACDITYCTAKELVFDYLRDGLTRDRDPLRRRMAQMAQGGACAPLLLRGLCMAIIDEADSILVDEARVPLILSQAVANEQQADYLARSLDLARRLENGTDFRLDPTARAAQLTARGSERIEALAAGLPAAWRNRTHREEMVCTALGALHLYRRDRHYLVRDGKVLIIDEATGRVAPGRAWSRGLHQLIELKEDCPLTQPNVAAAQITYQRFFPRYLRLGGLSGTLSESRRELLDIYRLAVRRVPLRQPDRRSAFPARLFPKRTALWEAVAARCAELAQAGRPVLVGTDSVADSEALSRCLQWRRIDHAVLNARNDSAEAAIVARAGQRGSVTVATNMAGRGTDIPLGAAVADLGGLHVLSCQLNVSRRIDRQLAGRCARQGDPGSSETWLPIDAQLFRQTLPGWLRRLIAARATALPPVAARALARWVQWRTERRHALERRRMLGVDRAMDRFSFGPRGD